MKNKMWKTALAAMAAAGAVWAFPGTAMAAPVLPDGIRVQGQDLAGKTCGEARDVIETYEEELGNRPVILTLDGQEKETTAKDLGLYWSNESQIEETLKEYAGGSLIRQYMVKKDLVQAPVELTVETAVDPEKITAFVDTHSQDILTQPQNASIRRENGAFVITEAVSGRAVDTEATVQALNEALAGQQEGTVRADAVITEQEPEITSEDLASIQDVLGTCTTDFSSSGAARSTNLSVGASKINGRILMPGEVLSGYECLQPFTTANGYKTAAAYENGKVVDSIGGGVCQIATTLYGASLEAEVEIVQRQNHSMIVTYVEPSMDAAIAGTYKDIKIKNNYSTPIYVEAYTSGKKLTFTLYGKETRPKGRKVEYISETTGTTSPGEPQLIVDNTMAPGAKVRVQSSHTGLKSRLWKVVTVDGVETERTLLNKDTYNASKAIYRVGPEVPVNAPAQTDPAGGQAAGAGENPSPESPGAENSAQAGPGGSGTVSGGGPGVSSGGGPGEGGNGSGPGASSGGGPGAPAGGESSAGVSGVGPGAAADAGGSSGAARSGGPGASLEAGANAAAPGDGPGTPAPSGEVS